MSLASLTVIARRAPPWTLVAVVSAALSFLGLAALVALGATRPVDLAVIRAFQSIASYALDLVANAQTVLGQLSVTLIVATLLALLIARRLRGWAWLAPALILVTGAIELAFKLGLQHPGPPQEFVRSFHNALGIRLEAPSSFPSGHVARVTFLAMVAAALQPRRWTWAAAALVAASSMFLRVYIGDHWISDALGGLALGTGTGALAVAWMRATARR